MLFRSSFKHRAFTLTELMISVALALLLLLGINQVFKTTSTTVGTSYAALEGARQQVAIDNVFDKDFNAATNVGNFSQPSIIIHSEAQTQYWDPNEANSDTFNNVNKVDLNGDGTITSSLGEDVSITGAADLRSGRVHRLDRISFFARDADVPYRRQTGDQKTLTTDPDKLVADESSTEAWIWYGFLRLPSNGSNLRPYGAASTPAGDYYTPYQTGYTAQQNTNNFYARDWALGHQTILLKSLPAGDYLTTNTTGLGSNKPLLAPLDANSQVYSVLTNASVNNSVTGNPWLAAHSRIDIAQTTIPTFRSLIQVAESTPITNPVVANVGNWFTFLDFSFNAKPWTDPSGDRGGELSGATPFLMRGVNQFIVEYAGDFVTQGNDPNNATTYGVVTSDKPDGILDFIVPPAPNNVRRTRWYGFPRDVAGVVSASNPAGGPDGKIDDLYDVVPLRDVTFSGVAQPFEHFLVNGVVSSWGGKGVNYLATPLASGSQYVCAWGPSELADTSMTTPAAVGTSATPGIYPGPWLVRIILNVRDSNNRLPNGTTIEHVYNLNK